MTKMDIIIGIPLMSIVFGFGVGLCIVSMFAMVKTLQELFNG